MAYSYVYYTGTGSATDFTVPFDYLDKADVKVVVNGNLITPTWLNDHTVTVSPAPVLGSIIKIYRETKRDARIVDFVDGSVLTESDLDKANQQSFYVAQEAFEIAGDVIKNFEDYTDQARQYADLAYKYERLAYDHRENARDAEDQSGVYKDLSGTYAEQAQLAAQDAEASKNASINFADNLDVSVVAATAGAQPSVVYDPNSVSMTFAIPPGPAGPAGANGPAGPAGSAGPAGAAATVTVGTVTTGAANTNASVVNSGTTSAAVLNFSIPRGEAGATGPANTLTLGTVTGGLSASASITGTAPNQTLNLVLPKGDTGDTGATGPAGPANSLAIGTVATGSAGSSADATITGTAPNQTLNLTIPRGETGAKGDTGNTGPAGRGISTVVRTSGTGAPGTTDTYTITYSDSSTSTFNVWNGTNGTGAGTVTSVDLTAPVGFSVSGNPVTSAGSLALSFAAGYSLPTTAKQTNWDTAYSWGNHASAGYLTPSVASANYQPIDADLTSIAGLAGTSGILTKTAANTWTLDTTSYIPTSGIGSSVQAYSANLTSWAGVATTAKQDTLVSGTNIKTINGTSVLGSGNVAVGTITSITAGTGLSGGTITGSGTIAIDSTVATLTGSQTLTNKTLTSPVLTTASTSGSFTLGGSLAETVFAVTGSTPALSPSNGTIQTWALTANSTPTAGTWTAGESMTLMVTDGTAFTITWTSLGVTWVGGTAPTLDTTKQTVIELWKVGTTIYGALVGAA